MKRILSVLVFMLVFVTANINATVNVVRLSAEEVTMKAEAKNLPSEFQGINVEQFLKLTPAEYKNITGHKLGLKNTVVLKVAQWKVKKAMEDGVPGGGKS